MPGRTGRWPEPLADTLDPVDLDVVEDLLAVWDVSPAHKRNTRYTLTAFGRWVAARGRGLFEATEADCRDWFAARTELVAPATQVGNWTQLLGFYRHAQDDRLADALAGRRSPMTRIPMPRAPKYSRNKAARGEEYDKLLEAFDKRTFLGLRDATIVSLMFRSGLRVGELGQLDIADVDVEARRLQVEQTKTDVPKVVPLDPETLTLLRRYLRRRGEEAGPLFVNVGPRRRNPRLTTSAIQSMFKRAAKRAGVPLTPHTLRRGFVGDHIEHGGDVVTAMTIGGWTREVMVHRYLADRRDDVAQAKFDQVAANRIAMSRRGQRRLRPVR